MIFLSSKYKERKRTNISNLTGAVPGFQARGGALKKIATSGGRCEKCLGISCEKSRFYAKSKLIDDFSEFKI
jgi:hypothetical protein